MPRNPALPSHRSPHLATLVAGLLAAALLLPLTANAQGTPKLEFELDGYYRARGHLFVNLFDKEFPKDGARDVPVYYLEDADTDVPDAFRDSWNADRPTSTNAELVQGYCRQFPAQCRRSIKNPNLSSWFTQRGRFEPTIRLGGIEVKTTIDVFDNVIWGDNENLAATPLFAGNPSSTQPDGTVVDSIRVKRLWAEWSTAFGLLRIGRQPSNWGLGILANNGDGFKNDFGDANDGAVYDRIIFATQPIALVKGIANLAGGNAKTTDMDSSIIVAVGFDKLVESSAITFQKRISDDDNIRDENDADTGGVRQSPIWLSDQGDDVLEMIYVLMFKKEDWDVGGNLMDLTVGTYWVNRWQPESESNVWIPDLYIKWGMRGAFFEGELYGVFGKTDAISPEFDKTTTAGIVGFVAKAGYENPLFTGLVEVGYAGGDDVILDDRFTGRPLHSDHNVGLILFEQVLAQRTVEKFANDVSTQGLWSNGGVYNATYVNPRFKLRPGDVWEFRLGFLLAWANQVDGAIIPYLDREDGSSESRGDITEDKLLGAEVDLGIHMKWLDDHILISMEAGYMRAGPRLGRTTQYQDPSESLTPLAYTQAQFDQIQNRLRNVFTVQGRFAFIF